MTFRDPRVVTIDALDVLGTRLARDLLVIAKFVVKCCFVLSLTAVVRLYALKFLTNVLCQFPSVGNDVSCV